jgi:hypothetical protein
MPVILVTATGTVPTTRGLPINLVREVLSSQSLNEGKRGYAVSV